MTHCISEFRFAEYTGNLCGKMVLDVGTASG